MSVADDAQSVHRNAVAYINARLSYLRGASRDGSSPEELAAQPAFIPATRYEFEVQGVGRDDKEPPAAPTDARLWRQPFADVMAGAYTYKVPISFRMTSTFGKGLVLRMGTWSATPRDDAVCVRRAGILRSLLTILYPVVNTTAAQPFVRDRSWSGTAGGLIRGQPTAKPPAAGDNVLPIDRLVRALGGQEWSISVLAAPEAETLPQRLREALVAELAFAEDAEKARRHDLPIVKQFTDIVEPTLRALLEATTTGAWRTAVYLEADTVTYPLLASVWRSVFSGERSTPETITVMDLGPRQAADLAAAWAFPLAHKEQGPAKYQHPFEYQTLLNSAQLSSYVHLPSVEVPGFWVDVIPRFDVSVTGDHDPGPRLVLGAVVAQPTGNRVRDEESARKPAAPRKPAGPPFSVSLAALSRHVFIAGVTGSGKTNTSLQLLRGLHAKRVPFLVIEPAKREYRELAHEPGLASQMQVFTAASDEGVPFRINPFEVEPGTTVAEHIDLLRAVFAASFGDMWTPLPQVLEQCMLDAYRARGWILQSDHNHRLAEGEDRSLAFPTLRELAGTVDAVVDRLGFDPEARDRVRGSLAARIGGLRVGSKGVLFDSRASLSMEGFLGGPAILELERLADESDKAFLIGLLLIRLVEFRRGQRRSGKQAGAWGEQLRHVLVIEEAHRLLANVSQGGAGDNTARVQAVESFSNLLAEIRAYGQGIVVIDQVPTKLAPDVIKNTNLKIAHRIVDEADRKVLGGSMSMRPGQTAALASLPRGAAAVFGGDDDAPVLVRMDGPPDDAALTRAIPPTSERVGQPPLHWGCVCLGDNHAAPECQAAGELAERVSIRQGISRIAAGAMRAGTDAELSTPEIVEQLRRDTLPHSRERLLIGCLAARAAESLADDWGARGAWPFGATSAFADALRRLLVDALEGRAGLSDAAPAVASLSEYQRVASDLHLRTTDPYPGCSSVCSGDLAGSCLYRRAVTGVLERSEVFDAFRVARARDASDGDVSAVWEMSADRVALEVLGPNVPAPARRAPALCFVQQALTVEDPPWPPWSQVQHVSDLVVRAEQDPRMRDAPPADTSATPSGQPVAP